MGRSNKRRRNKKLSQRKIKQLLMQQGGTSMTEDKKALQLQINELIGEIQRKDERKTVVSLESEIFEKKDIIRTCIYKSSTASIDKLRRVKEGLEKYKNKMRDYSQESEDVIAKKVTNLIANKHYKKVEIARLMGKTDNHVSNIINSKQRQRLLDVYDFVTMLPKKKDDVKPAPPNLIPTNKTNDLQKAINKNSGMIHVVKLAFGDAEYYLESVGESQIVFVKASDRAQWFDETPEAKLEFLTGRKKVVVEFD